MFGHPGFVLRRTALQIFRQRQRGRGKSAYLALPKCSVRYQRIFTADKARPHCSKRLVLVALFLMMISTPAPHFRTGASYAKIFLMMYHTCHIVKYSVLQIDSIHPEAYWINSSSFVLVTARQAAPLETLTT